MGNLLGLALLLVGVVTSVHYLDSIDSTASTAVSEPSDRGQSPYAPRSAEIAADGSGHFRVEATVNGRTVPMIADTGASSVALTEEDARRAGLNPGKLDYAVAVDTANGTAHAAAVRLDFVEVDGIVLRDVDALILQSGLLRQSLLGMSYIGRLASFSLQGETLILVE